MPPRNYDAAAESAVTPSKSVGFDSELPPVEAYEDDLASNRSHLPPADAKAESSTITIDDFYAYMPDHRYIFAMSRELWPAASINARLPAVDVGASKPMRPSEWLDQNRAVEQMTWAPGEPLVIKDRLISDGGWISRNGCKCFNLYRPPHVRPGNPAQATRWLQHLQRIYPEEAMHIVRWLAHRVQRPGEKVNHALVLGGAQGIGKDTLLEPVKYAVGPWNVAEVSPAHLLGRFNSFVKSVILRISEARDLGDVDRYGFYDHMKVYTAAPPDVLRCDEKNIREHSVLNVTGVIITTNHKADGIYLPADDRRHFVAWSTLTKSDFNTVYFRELYRWYESGGNSHVAAYLASVDLRDFDAKAPPPKTAAFHEIVDASRAPEDSELADVLDELRNPDAVSLSQLANCASEDFRGWLTDRRNRRQIPHRLESASYVPCRNPAANDGLWKVWGKRQAIYVRRTLSIRDALSAASKLGTTA